MLYLSLPYVLLYAIAVIKYKTLLPKWLVTVQESLVILYFIFILLISIISIKQLFFYYNIIVILCLFCILRPFNGYYLKGKINPLHFIMHLIITIILSYFIML